MGLGLGLGWVTRHVRVDCRERVVEEVYVGLRVARAREGDALLLAARDDDALLAHLGGVRGLGLG